MSRTPDLPPLPSDVRSLLERTRAGGEPPAALRHGLRARLAPALSLPLPTAPAAPPLGRIAHRIAGLLSKKAPLAMLSFGLGAGTGATVAVRAVHAANAAAARASAVVLESPPSPPPGPLPAVVPVVTPPPSEPVTPKAHPRAQLARPETRPAPPSPAVAPSPAAAPSETEPDRLLAAERVLLEKGRSALARGDTAGALAAVAEHAQGFPNGALREERDALRIQAFVGSGRKAEAAEALTDFAHRYPRSMLTPALRRTLQ